MRVGHQLFRGLATWVVVLSFVPAHSAMAVAAPAVTLTSTSANVAPAAQVTLTAGMPVVGAGTVSQEIVQRIDPTKMKLTSVSDIAYPTGWTLSYSTDGSTFSATTPANSAAWAAVRAVKATGNVNSQGTENGYQIATGTATGSTVSLSPGNITASGGGDGYQAFFDPARTRIFNVYHHATGNQLDCHVISTGATCSGFPFAMGITKTGQYSTGRVVGSRIWVPAYRQGASASLDSVGFYCVNIANVISSGGSPSMCSTSFVPLATGTDVNVGGGFTRASSAGLYEFRSIGGVTTAGSSNETVIWASLASNGTVVCLDTATGAACPGMPTNGWTTAVKGWKLDSTTVGGYFTSMVVSEGRIYVEGSSSTTNNTPVGQLTVACVLASNPTVECPGFTGGKNLGANSAKYGAAMVGNLVELPAADGTTAGVCLLGDTRSLAYYDINNLRPASSTSAVPCWDSTGTSFNAPASLSTMVTSAFLYGFSEYQQPLRTGSRVYWGNGVNFTGDANYPPRAFCWDASKSSGSGGPCANLPSTGYSIDNYTVSPDPSIPDCMWVTRDSQPNLISYNMVGNSSGCASIAPTRATFAGNTVVPRMSCSVSSTAVRSWKAFTLTSPAPSANFSAVLSVRSTDGVAIDGWQNVQITAGTPLDLSTLNTAVTGAAPSFLVDFTVSSGSVSSATAAVQAVGDAPQLCLTTTVLAVCPSGAGPLSRLGPSSATVSAEGSATDSSNTITSMTPASTILSISTPANAQCGATLSGTATVTGTSVAVANATVTLLDSSGNPILDGQGNQITTTTAADGTYSFGYLFPGNYKVKFADAGTQTATTATVTSGGSGSSSRSANTLVSPTAVIAAGVNAVVNAAYNTPAVATADTSTGAQGATQTINVKANDLASTGKNLTSPTITFCITDSPASGCSLTSKTVPGQGVYTLSGGNVVFTPCSAANTPAGASCTGAFTGTATPVAYNITDSGGSSSTSTITPTVVPPPSTTADTSSGPYYTAQTKNILTNDSAGSGATLSASTVRLCNPTTTPAQTPNNCTVAAGTTITVSNVGTYSVDSAGVVTFTPAATFYGTPPALKYQVQDSLGQYANSTYTPTVTAPAPATAVPDTSSGTQGVAQTKNILANDSSSATGQTLTTSSTRLCSSGQTPPNCTATMLSVAGEGNYSLNTSTGVVTFTPCSAANTPSGASCTAAFAGVAAPVRYQVTTNTGQTSSSTYTPTVTPPPTANPDTGTGSWDTNQTFTPLANDSAGAGTTLNPVPAGICTTGTVVASCTGTSLTVANEGTYSLNTTTGVITFDPLPSFTGTATPIRYVAVDALGQKSASTVTPTVTPPPAPTASSQQKTVLPGSSVAFTTLTGTGGLASSGGPAFTTSATCLIDPADSVCKSSVVISGQGTYTVNTSTGVVTFAASAGATPGTKTPVTYRVTDATGQTATSTLTPVVPPPPTASNDTSYDEQNQTQVISVLGNDTASAYSTLSPSSVRLCAANATAPFTGTNCNLTTLTESNKGKYTVNADGTVTFVPCTSAGVAACPGGTIFNGTAGPVRYVVADNLGQYGSATIAPVVLPPPAARAVTDTGTAAFAQQVILNTTSNDSPGTLTGLSGYTSVGSASVDATSVRLCSAGQSVPSCTATYVSTVDGSYSLNTSTGVVTFTPATNFTGTATAPPTYMVCNQLGAGWSPITPTASCSSASLVPTILPPGSPNIANDSSSGPYNSSQTINVLSNDTKDPSLTLVASSVRLCGPSQSVPNCTLTSLTVSGEGTYAVNTSTGAVTFTPVSSFRGTVASPPTYQVADSFGAIASATITPTVAPPTAPSATPQRKAVLQGATVAFTNVIGTSALATGTGLRTGGQNGPCIFDPSDSVCKDTFTITGEGTWTIDRLTGVPVFDADPAAASGDQTPVTYQVTDIVGQVATASLTPVLPPVATPANDTSINALDVNQTLTPLSNDSAATGTTWSTSTLRLCGTGEAVPNCSQTSLSVAGEGTYTVNANGSIVFDPLPTFTGTATPVDYQVEDSLGRVYTASLTPRVTTTPPTARPATVSLQVGGTATFTVLHGNGGLVAPATGGPALDTSTACIVDPVSNLCGTTVTIAGEGTYTLNTSSGVVTFVSLPNATTGQKTPVTYRITDLDGFVATSTLTPTLNAPTPVNPNTTPNQTVTPGSNTVTPGANTVPGQGSGTTSGGGSTKPKGSASGNNSGATMNNAGALPATGFGALWMVLLGLMTTMIGVMTLRRARRHS